MDVLFITSGGLDKASTRYRVLEMLPHLRDSGMTCSCLKAPGGEGPISKISFAMEVLKKAPQHDLIFVQKVLFPPWFLKFMSHLVDGVIFDFDDAIYTSPPHKTGGRSDLLNANLANASVVIAGSPTLASYAESHARRVYCLPTSIPKEKYKKWTGRQTGNGPRLGWIGNPENLIYLDMIAHPLKTILNDYPETELWIITAGELPVKPLSDRSDVVYKQWSRDRELKLLSATDIGIRPLYDDEWTRAKGGFTSVVQCMALQLPVVVSPVGMLTDMIDQGENGFFATEDEEWIQFLSRRINDVELRRQLGKRAYDSISEQRFWTEQRAVELYNVLETEYHSA